MTRQKRREDEAESESEATMWEVVTQITAKQIKFTAVLRPYTAVFVRLNTAYGRTKTGRMKCGLGPLTVR